jgi:hypothetical protein
MASDFRSGGFEADTTASENPSKYWRTDHSPGSRESKAHQWGGQKKMAGPP